MFMVKKASCEYSTTP